MFFVFWFYGIWFFVLIIIIFKHKVMGNASQVLVVFLYPVVILRVVFQIKIGFGFCGCAFTNIHSFYKITLTYVCRKEDQHIKRFGVSKQRYQHFYIEATSTNWIGQNYRWRKMPKDLPRIQLQIASSDGLYLWNLDFEESRFRSRSRMSCPERQPMLVTPHHTRRRFHHRMSRNLSPYQISPLSPDPN